MQPMSPIDCARRPLYSAPMDCAPSSITTAPRSRAISRMGSMSAHPPYRCTGIIALARGVRRIVCANPWGSMLYVAGSMSTNTGVAPALHDRTGGGKEREGRGEHRVAMPDARGHHGQQERVRPGGTANGVGDVAVGGDRLFKLLHVFAHDEGVGIDHPRHGGQHLIPYRLVQRRQVEQRHFSLFAHKRHRIVASKFLRQASEYHGVFFPVGQPILSAAAFSGF